MIKDQLIISINDPILRNHKAYGQELMPGLAYIDLLYQFFAELGYLYSELELRNLAIFHPLTVSEGADVHLNIECVALDENSWKIQLDGGGDGSGKSTVRYISAEMHRLDFAGFDERINQAEVFDNCTPALSMDEVYGVCARQQLVHTGVMRATGNTCENRHDYFAGISVVPEAEAEAADFYFHPALIDGGANAAGVILSREILPETVRRETLFLPLYYESFRATELIQSDVLVRIRKSSVKQSDELLTWSMDYFNGVGKKVGELNNLSIKMVRDQGTINPHLSETGEVGAAQRSRNEVPPERAFAYPSGLNGYERAELLTKTIIAAKLGCAPQEIDVESGYYEMGLDSAMLLEVVSDLEQRLSTSLAPTLLFEYTNINALAEHLSQSYSPSLSEATADGAGRGITTPFTLPEVKVSPAQHTVKPLQQTHDDELTEDGVAIIGVSGRYPGAANVAEFWENLLQGKDCITEIPPSRWDHHHLDGIQSGSGKAISKWGGFVDDVDRFDPQFFRISPKDAKNIDPQERLFLEVCWEAIEDSGYIPEGLSGQGEDSPSGRVGVFAGVMHKDYMMLGAEAVAQGEQIPVTLNSAAIANRVSYFCDFHGPSLVVDTACSASMTAIHLAIESIKRGECDTALAGGVNLSLHPNKYMTYGMADMFSSDGYCHTFGEGGDGYVSGEGVGAVLLKPLSQAVKDGDNIYAVIRGSAVNHVGKVGGITVPSPVAQYQVIRECYERAGIDPRTVSYVEAHGTGTSLGDPIEVQGLSRAFSHFTRDKQFCAIGSVKSNIGHAEAAAGVSGLTKVAMQLRHKTLVPSLHSETVNPHLDLPATPFFVQRTVEHWEQPAVEKDGRVKCHPRRAGISSFGATGSNVHLIVEEYQADAEANAAVESMPAGMPVIIPVSAKNETRLKVYLSRILRQVKNAVTDRTDTGAEAVALQLRDVAYTLQLGRVALSERFVAVVDSLQGLVAVLEAYLDRDELPDGVWRGPGKSDNGAQGLLSPEDAGELIARWGKQNRLEKIAALWVQGFSVPWERLYDGDNKPRRISLPTYPFAREICWLPVNRRDGNRPGSGRPYAIHPLLQRNTSDFDGQRFTSLVSADEFFIKENVGSAPASLPGLVYLEMVREAVSRSVTDGSADGSSPLILSDVIWSTPLQLDGAARPIHLALSPGDSDRIFCEIYTDEQSGDDAHRVLCQCEVLRGEADRESTVVDVAGLKRKLNGTRTYDSDAFYKTLEQRGAAYGPSLKGVASLTLGANLHGETEALANLSVGSGGGEGYVLHPALLLSVQQSIIALGLRDGKGNGTGDFAFGADSAPFFIRTFEVYGDAGRIRWAWLRRGEMPEKAAGALAAGARSTSALDIDLCDEAGNIIIAMKGVTLAQKEGAEPRTDVQHGDEPSLPRTDKPYPVVHLREEVVATVPEVAASPAKPDSISLITPAMVRSEHGASGRKKPSGIQLAFADHATLLQKGAAVAQETLLEMRDYGDGVICIRFTPQSEDEPDIERFANHLIACLDSAEADQSVSTILLELRESAASCLGDGVGTADKEALIANGVLLRIVECTRPVIALLPDGASGLDWLLASVCDFMVCAEEEVYGYRLCDLAWVHHLEERQLLTARFGADAAGRILGESHGIYGKALAGIGIGVPVVPAGEVESYARDLAYRFASMPATSLRTLKSHLTRSFVKSVSGFVELLRPAANTKNEGDGKSLAFAPNPFEAFCEAPTDDDVAAIARSAREVVLAFDTVRIESIGGNVANLIMCDRGNSNAFEEGLVRDVMEAFAYLDEHPEFRAVVLSGYDHYFSLGGTKQGLLAIQAGRASYSDAPLYELPLHCKVPVISAMQGHAIGAGWSFGMFADLQMYARESSYATRFMQFGFTPGFGSTLIFPERLGRDLGWEVLYTARTYTGEALSLRLPGLVVKPRATVQNHALAVAARLAQMPRDELVALKRQAVESLQTQLSDVVRLEQTMHAETFVGNAEALARIQEHYEDEPCETGPTPVQSAGVQPAQKVATPHSAEQSIDELRGFLRDTLSQELDLQPENIAYNTPFIDLGLDSISGVTWIRKINEAYGLSIVATKVYSHPTLDEFASYLLSEWKPGGESPAMLAEASADSVRPQVDDARLPQIKMQLCTTLAEELDLEPSQIGENTPFIDLGLDSISGVTWIRKINDRYGLSIIATKVYSYPTIAEFAAFVLSEGEVAGAFGGAKATATEEAGQTGAAGNSLSQVRQLLRETLAGELDLQPGRVDDTTPFIDLGLDSISGVTWIRKINERYGLSIIATKVYSYPTIAEFAEFVMQEGMKQGLFDALSEAPLPKEDGTEPGDDAAPLVVPQDTATAAKSYYPALVSRRAAYARGAAQEKALPSKSNAIAVIGVAGQFPKARTLSQFWDNLVQGRDCVTEVPAHRWDVDEYYDADPQASGKTHCRWMGALDDVASFDPLFFNISPKEAELMDPQQRLFLQNAWHCIEDAGYTSKALSGTKCGVFAGSAVGDYGKLVGDERLTLPGLMGDTSSMLAARIAYFLNLQGPCMSIDTACSSSLVAIASACESLASGASDMALAGGAYVMSTPEMHIMASKAGMLSEDGRCFTFDQRANGFVPGEGVGVLLLKRLEDAERDGDRIHGVIKGWGVNQDGKTNGITAPNPESQTRLESDVYTRFDINPEDIQLIETHGTGTKLGDPIEIEGLKSSFANYTHKKGYCALGSVKSNIGHLLTAAGVAGVIKLLLSIKHRGIPPTINFEKLNEHIELHDSPFYISEAYKSWEAPYGKPRCSAISSFGFSGTNAHLVMAEYAGTAAVTQHSRVAVSPRPIPLSARDGERLNEYAGSLLDYLESPSFEDTDESLGNLAYTLQIGRDALGERVIFIPESLSDLKASLRNFIDGKASGKGGHYYTSTESRKISVDAGTVKGWLQDSRLDKLARYWAGGGEVDWNDLYGDARPSRISAPTYPFAAKRYWVAAESKAQTGKTHEAETLLGDRLELAIEQPGIAVFETALPYESGNYIKKYGFAGRHLVPASVFVSLMLSAAKATASDEAFPVVLKHIKFLNPLYLSDTAERVQTVVKRTDDMPSSEIKVFALGKDNQWIVLASAEVDTAPGDRKQLTTDVDIAGGMSGDEFYAACARSGMAYQHEFKSIVSLHYSDGVGIADFTVPDVIARKDVAALDGVPHPTVVDALFQIMMSLVSGEGGCESLLLPGGVESFSLAARCGQALKVEFQLESAVDTGRHVGDFVLYDRDGGVVAEVSGVTVVESVATDMVAGSDASVSGGEVAGLMLLNNMLELTEDEVYQTVIDGIARMLSDVLSVDVNEEFANQQKFLESPLTALGVDSLTTQELCKRIRMWLDVDVPVEKIIGGGRVQEVAEFIQMQLILRGVGGASGNDVNEDKDVDAFVL